MKNLIVIVMMFFASITSHAQSNCRRMDDWLTKARPHCEHPTEAMIHVPQNTIRSISEIEALLKRNEIEVLPFTHGSNGINYRITKKNAEKIAKELDQIGSQYDIGYEAKPRIRTAWMQKGWGLDQVFYNVGSITCFYPADTIAQYLGKLKTQFNEKSESQTLYLNGIDILGDIIRVDWETEYGFKAVADPFKAYDFLSKDPQSKGCHIDFHRTGPAPGGREGHG